MINTLMQQTTIPKKELVISINIWHTWIQNEANIANSLFNDIYNLKLTSGLPLSEHINLWLLHVEQKILPQIRQWLQITTKQKPNCFLLKNENWELHKEQIDVLWSGCHSCCSFPIPSSSQRFFLPSSIRNRIRDIIRIINVFSSTLPFNDISILWKDSNISTFWRIDNKRCSM